MANTLLKRPEMHRELTEVLEEAVRFPTNDGCMPDPGHGCTAEAAKSAMLAFLKGNAGARDFVKAILQVTEPRVN